MPISVLQIGPGKSAIDAVHQARQRCWRYDWVLDLDVKAYFDSIDWELMLKAVRHHTNCPWVLLYIERWLKAPVQLEDGSVVLRAYGASWPTALRLASWCCILRRRRLSIARMRTGAVTSQINRSTFSVLCFERGRRCGKEVPPRTASCLRPGRGRWRPSAGQSGAGPFIITVANLCKIWPRRTTRTFKAGSTTTATSTGRNCVRP